VSSSVEVIEAPGVRGAFHDRARARATSSYADCSELRYSSFVVAICAFLYRSVEVDQDARVP